MAGASSSAPRAKLGHWPSMHWPRHASSPVFLKGPGQAVAWEKCASLGKERGRAERRVLIGPTDLDASRHRGLSKSLVPQVRQVAGVPRAMFVGLLRVVPGGRPVRPHTRLEALKTLHPWARQLGRRSSDRTQRRTGRQRAHTCGSTPGATRLGPPEGCLRRISNAPSSHRTPPNV